jgi:2-polyprenyl-3-methyl-5-hydroxy-6-metoxy-1,4-benzoquinol methylase
MANCLQNFFGLLSNLSMKTSNIFAGFSKACSTTQSHQQAVINSTQYNMMSAPDEPYYANQYWHVISPQLEKLPENSKILDLGCSQGRLTIQAAKQFSKGQIQACDLSQDAITSAKSFAEQHSVRNIDYQVSSISDCLAKIAPNSFDAVMMTEVTFFHPGWTKDFPKLLQTLKPSGLLVMSFRSQFFNALSVVKNKMWNHAETVLRSREGMIFGNSASFSWQTSDEIKRLFAQSKLEILDLRGIGIASGIPGDPHASIAQPSKLSEGEKKQLMELELELGKTVPDAGRYMLVVARKQN